MKLKGKRNAMCRQNDQALVAIRLRMSLGFVLIDLH
jgi:hypothetical protein